MKKEFIQKLSCLILGLLLLSPQLKADDAKVDYTDYIVNPSFEYYVKDGVADLDDPVDVTNASDPRIVGSAHRATPPGWQDSGTITPPETGNMSYGINRGAVNKDGYNLCWAAPTPFPESFELYQEITGLPAGQYIVTCRFVIFQPRLTNQRIFVQTKNSDGEVIETIVQYFGDESDYSSENLTIGETNTYAGWEFTTAVSDAEARLKPMSVIIDVAEGNVLRIGVKTSNLRKDGTRATDNSGFFKVDDFRIMSYDVPADPNDYTYKITNPSFELNKIGDEDEFQLKNHNLSYRGTPYGWSDIKDGFTGESYGVNTDANNIHGAKVCWVQSNPMPNPFELYQELTGLPSGIYQVSCNMYVENNRLTTQRLFANNNVQYYSTEWEYYNNLTDDETNTFAGWNTQSSGYQDGIFLRDMSVEVAIEAGETLRLGVRTNNVQADGKATTGVEGLFKLDNFRFKRIVGVSGLNKVNEKLFFANAQKGGFWLNMEQNVSAYVRVVSLSGKTVYNEQLNNTSTWITLPEGLYIVHLSTPEMEKSIKVLVK